jgi:hypothetical protein
MADWKTVATDGSPPLDGHTTYIGINSAGYACCFNAMQGGTCVMETAEGRYRQMSDLRDWRLLDRPARGGCTYPACACEPNSDVGCNSPNAAARGVKEDGNAA